MTVLLVMRSIGPHQVTELVAGSIAHSRGWYCTCGNMFTSWLSSPACPADVLLKVEWPP